MAYDFSSGASFNNTIMNDFNLATNNRHNASARNSLINTIKQRASKQNNNSTTWLLKTYDGRSGNTEYGEFSDRIPAGDYPNRIAASSVTDNILGFDQSKDGTYEYLKNAKRDTSISSNLFKLANIDLFKGLEI